MSEETDVLESEIAPSADLSDETAEPPAPPEDREPMPPVESRFMFVDIAALRAKQLRRGALPRVTLPTPEVESDTVTVSQKLERIAMQEVEDGLIVYEFQDPASRDSQTPSEKTP